MVISDFDTAQVMAVVNVTDDSFYALSRSLDVSVVEARIEQVVAQGATIIDIGGYSSRPGAADVDLDTEWQRVDMGVGAARRIAPNVALSIDTFRSEIVRRTVEKYGEVMVNDISAGQADENMIATVAELDLQYVAMHMRGTPQSMQSQTDYSDVAEQVISYLSERAALLESKGVKRQNIILDPGFGFAKSMEQNYQLLKALPALCGLGYPVLVGLSRKSMIYKLLETTPEDSLAGTIALCWQALVSGAKILRVHDVRQAAQIVTLYDKGFKHL